MTFGLGLLEKFRYLALIRAWTLYFKAMQFLLSVPSTMVEIIVRVWNIPSRIKRL